VNEQLASEPRDRDEAIAALAYEFAIAVVRHLQRDPVLPAALLPDDWPATGLRSMYRSFDDAFKRRMTQVFRPSL